MKYKPSVILWAKWHNPSEIHRDMCGTDTASVELFFNIFNSGIETFIIPWDQLLYPCVVEVCRLGLEPLCDTHLCHSENADSDQTAVSWDVRKDGNHWVQGSSMCMMRRPFWTTLCCNDGTVRTQEVPLVLAASRTCNKWEECETYFVVVTCIPYTREYSAHIFSRI